MCELMYKSAHSGYIMEARLLIVIIILVFEFVLVFVVVPLS
jgi:hypothetical protein